MDGGMVLVCCLVAFIFGTFVGHLRAQFEDEEPFS